MTQFFPPHMHDEFYLNVYAVDGPRVWPRFAPHHYLTGRYAGHRAWLAVLPTGDEVAFTSLIRFPCPGLVNAWRLHRVVALPDYQGLGIGSALVDWMAAHVQQTMTDDAGNVAKVYARFRHTRLAAHDESSPRWTKVAGSGGKARVRRAERGRIGLTTLDRPSFAYRYVGGDT